MNTTKETTTTVAQNTTARYLKRTKLQRLLERLFPGHTEFNIEMKDDQWCFTVPKAVTEVIKFEIEATGIVPWIRKADLLPVHMVHSAPYNSAPSRQGAPAQPITPTELKAVYCRGSTILFNPSWSNLLNPILNLGQYSPPRPRPVPQLRTMNSKSFVQEIVEPIKIVDLLYGDDDASGISIRSREITTLEQLHDYLESNTYNFRFISISQKNSWRPLQITQPMLECIASKHQLGPGLMDVASCFYNRNMTTEEAYCIPFTQTITESSTELAYTIRYPEYKQSEGSWAIRQSGICQSFKLETSQNVCILFSPVPTSALQERLKQTLALQPGRFTSEDFLIHELLFSTYYPAWRTYIAAQEQVFLPISGTTFSTYIDKPLRLGYEQLSALASLHNKFLQMPAMLAHGAEVLGELSWLLNDASNRFKNDSNIRTTSTFRNMQRHCLSNSRNAAYLQQRVHSTGELLSDTLSFRDQVVAKEQNGTMLQLNKSAVFITMLTLLYLPASFVASFFGMNFFDYDNESGNMVGSSMIWIFVVATLGLTAATFLSYYWLLKHDGELFSKVAPTVHVRDWKHLKRRFSLRGDVQASSGAEKLPV